MPTVVDFLPGPSFKEHFMSHKSVWLLGIGVSAVLAVAGRSALADDANRDADKLIRHGIELRRRLDDDNAAREFQKAYDLVHTPRAAAQLGLAEQALGRWEDAERHVGEALGAADDPWVTKNREALERSLATIQAHLGRVEVIGDPEGAAVSVNGRSVGKLPLPNAVRVSAGQVDVGVSAEGFASEDRTFSIIGGQYQRIVIHLAKKTAETPRSSGAITPVETAAPPKVSVAPPPAPPEEGPSQTRVALKWTAAGLAGAGLLTGIIGTVLHSNNVSSFKSQGCFNDGGRGVDASGTPVATCQSALDASNTDQTFAIVGYVAAGAFAATWLVLQLTEPSSGAGPAAQQASRWPLCAPSPAGLGLSCAARF